MLSSMSPDLQRTLEKCNAFDMMKELKTMFEELAKKELFETVKAFHAYKQKDSQSVSSYLLKLKSYVDTLERLAYAMPHELGVGLILNSLNKDYNQFVQNYNMHSMGKTLAKLHAMLKLHEKGIPKKAETPVVLAIREGKIHKDKKKPQGAKGKTKGKNSLLMLPRPRSHHRLREIIRQRTLSATTIMRRSRKLKHGALNMYMGNGMLVAVEAIESFDLILPSGLIIVLDNYNVIYFNAIPRDDIYEIDMYNLDPNGYEALVKRDMPDKLDSRSIKCIFVGYPKETMGYYFYYPLKNKIFVSRNAEFFENSFMVQEASGSHGLLEVSGSDKGLEIIQEEDTQHSENTRKEHDEVAPIEVEPQSVGVPIRRFARIPQALDIYGYYVNIEEYELGDFDEPPNYIDALADPESDKWLEAMNTKMPSIKDNQIIRDRSKRLIALSQSAYLEKILKIFRMKNSKKRYTSMMEKPDYRKSQGAKTHTDVQRMQRVPYASTIDSIMCATAVKTILKYLRNTKDMVLVYGAKPEDELKVSCYANANFQTDKDDTKSQTGYVFILNGGAVDWKSAKQSTTAMSSTEAVYIIAAEASMKAVWMRKFINEIGGVMPSNKRPMEMLCDNEAALAIAEDPAILKGARHFQRKYHYIREVIKRGHIKRYCKNPKKKNQNSNKDESANAVEQVDTIEITAM
nr:zinc finger, CCHC-type [Tanacetum cinerariifolium]